MEKCENNPAKRATEGIESGKVQKLPSDASDGGYSGWKSAKTTQRSEHRRV